MSGAIIGDLCGQLSGARSSRPAGGEPGIGEVGVEHGLTSVSDLAAIVGDHECADVRLALVREAYGWRVWHGEVTLGAIGAAPGPGRAWRYGTEIFLERRWPGTVVAGLLRQEPQQVEGLKVSASPSAEKCGFRRMAGQSEYLYVITPWPRTEWTISPAETMPGAARQGACRRRPVVLEFRSGVQLVLLRQAAG
jgi:hypothetical protein